MGKRFTLREACRGGRPRAPLRGGLRKRGLTRPSHPAAVSRRPGEREGGDTLPYNGAPASLTLYRAKSLRNFVTFAHAHRRFRAVFNWPDLCNVYKNRAFLSAGCIVGGNVVRWCKKPGGRGMYVLICNAGSTSLKFKLYDMPSERVLARGHIERVGSRDDAVFKYYAGGLFPRAGRPGRPGLRDGHTPLPHLPHARRGRGHLRPPGEIARVGYKATLSKGHYGVHELTDEVLAGMAEWISLAPLHNRVYLDVIRAMREVIPAARSVGALRDGLPPHDPPRAADIRPALRVVREVRRRAPRLPRGLARPRRGRTERGAGAL